MIVAAVAGASGYAGGELLRILHSHPDIDIGPVCAASSAGQRLGDVHPQLRALADTELLPTEPDVLGQADIVFLALPHGASGGLAKQLAEDVRIVDLGADFRLGSESAWRQYYPGDWAGSWTYGLPELPGVRARVAKATRVANPGCYPTGIILGLSPLLAAGCVAAGDIVVVAASGVSGAGRKASDSLLPSDLMGSVGTYKVGGSHQHIPEIEQALGWAAGSDVQLSFTPMLAPMPRGITAVSTARLVDGVTTEQIAAALHDAYDDEPFVSVSDEAAWPASGWTGGSNAVVVRGVADEHAGRAVVVSCIDNLGKGAAGQAVQNANIMLGLDETAGLRSMGVSP